MKDSVNPYDLYETGVTMAKVAVVQKSNLRIRKFKQV